MSDNEPLSIKDFKAQLNHIYVTGERSPVTDANSLNRLSRNMLGLIAYIENLEHRIDILEQGAINRRLKDLDEEEK